VREITRLDEVAVAPIPDDGDWRAVAPALDDLVLDHERSVRDESLPCRTGARQSMTSDDFADASLSVFAGVSVLIATPAEDGTSHPGGIEFIAALGWRGVVYGAADGLLPSAFPILRVFAALRDTRLRRRTGGVVAVGRHRDGRVVGDDRRVSRRVQRLSLGQDAQAGDRRPRLERAAARDAQPDRRRRWPTSARTSAQSWTTTTLICFPRLTEARKQARPATNKPSRVAG
jgi:hypothetical protein